MTSSVQNPCAEYESFKGIWKANKAVLGGNTTVRAHDAHVNFRTNLLVPFSVKMTDAQYALYKAEAELPQVTRQFATMLIGGLLRKQPTLTLPDRYDPSVANWLLQEIGIDGSPLSTLIENTLLEEIATSHSWIVVDHPVFIEGADQYPYPTLYPAESVINWRTNNNKLSLLVVSGEREDFKNDEFVPKVVHILTVHKLDEFGVYCVEKYDDSKGSFEKLINEDGTDRIYPLIADQPLNYIPAWPSSGTIKCSTPVFQPIIEKEIALYNKISRRNHLLYGAATYTPIVMSDNEEIFKAAVESGLGTWLRVGAEDRVDVLKTPTDALADMSAAITAGYDEIAKLGVRMLTPETGQSGVALELRNASQTAQLSLLNVRISNTLKAVFAFMLTWKYGEVVLPSEIEFTMSTDFDPTPLGVEWVQLVTDWYQQGITSREVWIDIIKKNDLLSPNYNDAETIQQIRDMAAGVTQGATPEPVSTQTGSDYLNKVNGVE